MLNFNWTQYTILCNIGCFNYKSTDFIKKIFNVKNIFSNYLTSILGDIQRKLKYGIFKIKCIKVVHLGK